MVKSNLSVLGRVLKVAIVLFAAVMLFFALRKFFADEQAILLFSTQAKQHPLWLTFVVLLIPMNWFLETAKWKKLIAVSETISWKDAWSGVLAGLAIGSATPNRIGEFAGRVFQLKKTSLLEGMSFTFISSFMQVGVTVLAGVGAILFTDVGNLIHISKTREWLLILTVFALTIGAILFVITKYKRYFITVRSVDWKLLFVVFGISALRYSVYATQFFIMLIICGVESPATTIFAAIAVNYLVVSVVPSVMITELFVRGTIASGVIGVCGNPEAAALAAVIIWLVNVGFPALCGMFFIRNLTFFRKRE